MKYLLTTLILVASMQQADALEVQTQPQTTIVPKTFPGSRAPYIPPAPIPPIEYDGTFKGKLVIAQMEDYAVIRFLCKSATAVACTVHTWNECLVLLGPGTWASKDIMRHELGHCAGWGPDHPGAR